MQIQDILGQLGGPQSMARELGVSEQDAHSGHGVGDMVDRHGGGGLLDNVLSPQPTQVEHGNNVLGQIFGSKDVSRSVTQSAAERTGLHPSLLERMLPMVAMMAAGYMAKQRGGGGGLAGLASSAMGGSHGGLGALLGMEHAGNALDDILHRTRGAS